VNPVRPVFTLLRVIFEPVERFLMPSGLTLYPVIGLVLAPAALTCMLLGLTFDPIIRLDFVPVMQRIFAPVTELVPEPVAGLAVEPAEFAGRPA